MKMNMLDYLPKGPISQHRSEAHSKIHVSSGCCYRQWLSATNERSRQRSRARDAGVTFTNAIYSVKYPQIQPWLHPRPSCSSLGSSGAARRARPAGIGASRISPSIHAAHPKAHPLRQLSTRFAPRGEDEISCLRDRALKHLLNASNPRLTAGTPPGRFFRRHLRSIHTAG